MSTSLGSTGKQNQSAPEGFGKVDPMPPQEPRPRPLWQAPMFLLGVLVLAVVWFGRPLVPQNPENELLRHLQSVREILAKPDGDLHAAEALAQRALDECTALPEHTGEALYLLGSAHLRLAEQAEGAEAAEHWKRARFHLDEALLHGVPEVDRGKLEYRLAKVEFHSGPHDQKQLKKVIRRLRRSADEADDRAESYGLLVNAYLQLQPPDFKGALEANKKQRQVPLASEDVLASARLLGGELLLRLGKPSEARTTLARVGAKAPPAIVAQARMLHGRSFQEEGLWGEAIKVYKAALADQKVPLLDPARALYNMGFCYRRAGQHQEAIDTWKECLRVSRGGVEYRPAAIGLAELQLNSPTPTDAIDSLTKAMYKIEKAEHWINPVVGLSKVRDVFEQAGQKYRQLGRFEEVSRVAKLYESIAPPGRARKMQAEALSDWARERTAEANQAETRAAQTVAQKEANKLNCQAAKAFLLAATELAEAKKKEQASICEECWWQAAKHFYQCGQYKRAIEELTRLLKRTRTPERQGQSYFLLAEAYRQVGQDENADLAYRECVKYPTRYAYRSRYQLAQFAIARGNLDEAEELLEQNLRLLRFNPDRKAQEKSLFALGDLFYKRHNFRMVVRRLEEALSRFPSSAEALRARYQLADSYRQLASQAHMNTIMESNLSEATQQHFLGEHNRMLQKAAREFTELDRQLRNGGKQTLFTKGMIEGIPYAAARCLFLAHQREEALRRYEDLIERAKHPLRKMQALGGAVSCLAAQKEWTKVSQRLVQMDLLLQDLDGQDHQIWKNWIRTASFGGRLLHAAKPAVGDNPQAAPRGGGAPNTDFARGHEGE